MTNTTDAAVFRRLRQLKADCGPNKHDQATALITACIMEGMDTGKRIIGALKVLGFDPQHVGIILNEGTGLDPERHHWRRDQEGTYAVHGEHG